MELDRPWPAAPPRAFRCCASFRPAHGACTRAVLLLSSPRVARRAPPDGRPLTRCLPADTYALQLRAKLLHRMLAFCVQLVALDVRDVHVSLTQQQEPGPSPAGGSHLRGKDAVHVDIRLLSLQPHGGCATRLLPVQRASGCTLGHLTEAALSHIGVSLCSCTSEAEPAAPAAGLCSCALLWTVRIYRLALLALSSWRGLLHPRAHRSWAARAGVQCWCGLSVQLPAGAPSTGQPLSIPEVDELPQDASAADADAAAAAAMPHWLHFLRLPAAVRPLCRIAPPASGRPG